MSLIQHFVNGKSYKGNSNRKGKVFNPATGEQESEVILGSKEDLNNTNKSIHRTFNMTDLNYFIVSLKNIYENYGGIENIISDQNNGSNIQERISTFKKIFFSLNHPVRSKKHLPSPTDGSSAKRFNMYLRWMVRSNKKGVDFGIWKLVINESAIENL